MAARPGIHLSFEVSAEIELTDLKKLEVGGRRDGRRRRDRQGIDRMREANLAYDAKDSCRNRDRLNLTLWARSARAVRRRAAEDAHVILRPRHVLPAFEEGLAGARRAKSGQCGIVPRNLSGRPSCGRRTPNSCNREGGRRRAFPTPMTNSPVIGSRFRRELKDALKERISRIIRNLPQQGQARPSGRSG